MLLAEARSQGLVTPLSFTGSGADTANALIEAFRWMDLATLELSWFHAESYASYEVIWCAWGDECVCVIMGVCVEKGIERIC